MRVRGVQFVSLLFVAGCSGGFVFGCSGPSEPPPASAPAPEVEEAAPEAAVPPPPAEEPPAPVVSDDPDAPRRGGNPRLAAIENPVPATPASVTAGRTTYNRACRHCHGIQGLGDGPLAPSNPRPSDLTDDAWDHGSTDGEIFAIIWNGAPAATSEMKGVDGTMSERNVWDLVNFLRSIGPTPGDTPAAP